MYKFDRFLSNLKKEMSLRMTFDPSVDLRNDFVNFYGYKKEEVENMSDDELFQIIDRIESLEKGLPLDEEYELPIEYKNKKCDCNGQLNVLYIDCETRGDCEIYVCECKECSKILKINYAAEWFDPDFIE